MLVKKYSGELVPFDSSKLEHSLKVAGAKEKDVQKILRRVREDMSEGKSTAKIYREAFNLLKRLSWASAARFNLKKAIMQLGPSGFPFEKFVAELFRFQGFEAQNNLILKGRCVKHEIDVLASKDDQTLIVECKFHNRQGIKSDVKVPMYFKSRVDDIRKGNIAMPAFKGKKIKGCLATNTRFSEDAITFSKCENILLLSWDYPINGSLKDRIQLSALYPITCLNGLRKGEKNTLLEQGIVMAKDLLTNEEVLESLRISTYRYKNILSEVRELCNA